MRLKNEKAFTIIELIVVIAIIGILTLLAAPRFLGYVQKAHLARIQNDVKVAESFVAEKLLLNDSKLPDNWEKINTNELTQLTQEKKLYDVKGLVLDESDIAEGNYVKLAEKPFNTKLKGNFYTNQGGKVYYEDLKSGIITDEDYKDGNLDNSGKDGSDPEQPGEPTRGKIPINSADELAKIGDLEYLSEYPLDGDYILTANIDLSGFDNWTPIGNSNTPFTGSFDGNGYKIINLKIDKPSQDYVGLFGYTSEATIENVALEDINVTSTGSYTGGLVGWIWKNTTISNSYATGSVEGTEKVGGLVGEVYKSSTISNSYATSSVEGTEKVGGLVGETDDSSKITNSYSTGSVTGERYTGGLVGYAWTNTTISNSYSTGSVSGGYYTGGLVGRAEDNTTISNSYATGLVSGRSFTGGLVGWIWKNTTVTNSYWNTETTEQGNSEGGSGRSTSQMKMRVTYDGWDFDNIWQINEGQSYPTLR